MSTSPSLAYGASTGGGSWIGRGLERFRSELVREARSALGEEAHRIRYWASQGRHARGRLRGSDGAPTSDLLLVLPAESRGWILEAIGRELARRWPGEPVWGDLLHALPRARNVWFSHYSFIPEALAHNPHLWGARRTALFTHDRELPWSWSEVAYCLDRCHRVVTMNERDRQLLAQRGVDPRRIRVAIPGIDAERFRPRGELGETIGFCSAYYPRKAPERVLAIARAFPTVPVLLLGRGWPKWEGWRELAGLANFEYIETEVDRYPDLYRRFRVFVSPSRIEGGPMPLLEALSAGIPVAASRTGFAPDLVREGIDGELFDRHAPIEAVIAAVGRALELPPVLDPPARRYTWDRFAGIVSAAWRPSARSRRERERSEG